MIWQDCFSRLFGSKWDISNQRGGFTIKPGCFSWCFWNTVISLIRSGIWVWTWRIFVRSAQFSSWNTTVGSEGNYQFLDCDNSQYIKGSVTPCNHPIGCWTCWTLLFNKWMQPLLSTGACWKWITGAVFPDFLKLNIRKWLIFSGDVRFQRVSDEFWGFMRHHTSIPRGFEYINK